MCDSAPSSVSAMYASGSKTATLKKSKKTEKALEKAVEKTPVIENMIPDLDSSHEKMIQQMEESITQKVGMDLEKAILEHLGEYIEEPYTLIDSYFRGKHLERLVRHQIESYNHFINYQIQRTIQMFNPVIIRSENDFIEDKGQYFLEAHVNFDNFKLYPPQIHENNGATKIMLPQEAKVRNFTYASTMTVDLQIKYIIRNTEAMDAPKIVINHRLPIERKAEA